MMNQTVLCQALLDLRQKGKSIPLCCTSRSWIVDQKPVARGQGHQWGRIMTWFFSALATANFIWAPVLRDSHLGTHSLYRPPSGSYLNPFNFLTCTWVIYMYEDLKPSLFAKQYNFEINSSSSRWKEMNESLSTLVHSFLPRTVLH